MSGNKNITSLFQNELFKIFTPQIAHFWTKERKSLLFIEIAAASAAHPYLNSQPVFGVMISVLFSHCDELFSDQMCTMTNCFRIIAGDA